MTITDEIQNLLQTEGITSEYTTEDINNLIYKAKLLIDEPALFDSEYTDYIDEFEGDVYYTNFYPLKNTDIMLQIGNKSVTPRKVTTNGVIYLNNIYKGHLNCTYNVGLKDNELNESLIPIVIQLIRNKEGFNYSSVHEGDISINYDNNCNSLDTLDNLILKLKNKFNARIRFI